MTHLLTSEYNYDLPVGLRDAIHVPIILAKLDPSAKRDNLKPGDLVQFTDEEKTLFKKSDEEFPDGILNPFLPPDTWISDRDSYWILLWPGITGPVRHTFDVKSHNKQEILETLSQYRDEDPGCAECYQIVHGKVIRY